MTLQERMYNQVAYYMEVNLNEYEEPEIAGHEDASKACTKVALEAQIELLEGLKAKMVKWIVQYTIQQEIDHLRTQLADLNS